MQGLDKKVLGEFDNEFEMVCAAHNGNGDAWMRLWEHYKGLMMSRIKAVQGMTREERESEAAEVFARKVFNFDKTKVNDPKTFSLFAWIYCASISHTHKLIRQSKRNMHLYGISDTALGDEGDIDEMEVGERMVGIDDTIYTRYSPERIIFEEAREDDTERIKEFNAKLTDFQKDILEIRRKGMTLAQTASTLHCSVTTVKNNIREAKEIAFKVFGIRAA